MKGIRIIIILIGLLPIAAFSQENAQDLLAPSRIAPISYELEGNTVSLRAATPGRGIRGGSDSRCRIGR